MKLKENERLKAIAEIKNNIQSLKQQKEVTYDDLKEVFQKEILRLQKILNKMESGDV